MLINCGVVVKTTLLFLLSLCQTREFLECKIIFIPSIQELQECMNKGKRRISRTSLYRTSTQTQDIFLTRVTNH